MRKFFSHPFYRFLLLALLLYFGWQWLYTFEIGPGNTLDKPIVENLVWLTSGMLHFLGFTPIAQPHGAEWTRIVGIDGTTGVWIGDGCNGITLLVIFLIFTLAYPGPWKAKLWFIPLGMISIHLLNTLRVLMLTIILKFHPSWLYFNHTYTFTLLIYGWVFFLWYLWASRFGNLQKGKKHIDAKA